MRFVSSLKKSFSVPKIFLRLFSAWLLSVACFYMIFGGGISFINLAFLQDISLFAYFAVVIFVFALLTALDSLFPRLKTDGKLLVSSAILFAFSTAVAATDPTYLIFLSFPLFAVFYIAVCGRFLTFPTAFFFKKPFSDEKIPLSRAVSGKKIFLDTSSCLIFASALIFSLIVVCGVGVLRYKTYSAPNYDFGIFVNMFHNMKESFLPLVTSERDKLLSHFAVHISPIVYLVLPFYAIFPFPETIQIFQAVVLISGVIPLILICKNRGLTRNQTALTSAAYLLAPALAGGTFYDFHENCFLPAVLLWLFCFYEKDRKIPMYIFAVLLLTVKEDAAVYLAFFALYVILSNLPRNGVKNKKILHGAALFILACAWFALDTALLKAFGTGTMEVGRYGDYIYGDGGFAGIVKTVFVNPGYVFSQMADAEYLSQKLIFIFEMLLPLGFMPFVTKKPSRYILVAPFLLINLMTLYKYQFDIGFQYNFGPFAFLVFAAVLNIADLRPVAKKTVALFCAVMSLLFFTVLAGGKFVRYANDFEKNREKIAATDEILSTIDKEKSVTASTMLLPHIADRDEIYEIRYHDMTGEDAVLTDYIVLDNRYSSYKTDLEKAKLLGYAVTGEGGYATLLIRNGDGVKN